MTKRTRTLLADQWSEAKAARRRAWQVLRTRGPSQMQFWVIALIIGCAAGFAVDFSGIKLYLVFAFRLAFVATL